MTKHLHIAGGVAEFEQPLRPTGWFSERTARVGRLTPLRRFVRTETGGAPLLVAAVLACGTLHDQPGVGRCSPDLVL